MGSNYPLSCKIVEAGTLFNKQSKSGRILHCLENSTHGGYFLLENFGGFPAGHSQEVSWRLEFKSKEVQGRDA